MAFWKELQGLHKWQQKYLPGTDTPHGMSLLIWLIKHDGALRPMGALYKECRSSEPSMRRAAQRFVEVGLAEIKRGDTDVRQRLISTTPKFRKAVDEYRRQLQRVGSVG